jgi:hypothetical protein
MHKVAVEGAGVEMMLMVFVEHMGLQFWSAEVEVFESEVQSWDRLG